MLDSMDSGVGCGRIRIVVLQPPSDLAKLGHAVFLVQLPGRAHERASLRLLLAREPPEHVAQLVVPAHWDVSHQRYCQAHRQTASQEFLSKQKLKRDKNVGHW